MFTKSENNIGFLLGLAVIIAAGIVTLRMLSGKTPGDTAENRPESAVASHTGRVIKSPASVSGPALESEIDRLREELGFATERLDMIADSAAYLEQKLIRVHVLTDSIIHTENKFAANTQPLTAQSGAESIIEELPPPAAIQGGTTAAKDTLAHQQASATEATKTPVVRDSSTETVPAGFISSPAPAAKPATPVAAQDAPKAKPVTPLAAQDAPKAKPVTPLAVQDAPKAKPVTPLAVQDAPKAKPVTPVAVEDTPAADQQDEPPEQQQLAQTHQQGLWVVNLASLASQADADRFTARARSKNIHTEQQQVTVKGKNYWRVQITGFSSAADARAQAGTVKKKLGLKNVWITTR